MLLNFPPSAVGVQLQFLLGLRLRSRELTMRGIRDLPLHLSSDFFASISSTTLLRTATPVDSLVGVYDMDGAGAVFV